jgi:hypothetical protein
VIRQGRADREVVLFFVGTLNFCFSKSSRPILEPGQLQGAGGFSLGIKQPVCVAYPLHPPNVEVKGSWRAKGYPYVVRNKHVRVLIPANVQVDCFKVAWSPPMMLLPGVGVGVPKQLNTGGAIVLPVSCSNEERLDYAWQFGSGNCEP